MGRATETPIPTSAPRARRPRPSRPGWDGPRVRAEAGALAGAAKFRADAHSPRAAGRGPRWPWEPLLPLVVGAAWSGPCGSAVAWHEARTGLPDAGVPVLGSSERRCHRGRSRPRKAGRGFGAQGGSEGPRTPGPVSGGITTVAGSEQRAPSSCGEVAPRARPARRAEGRRPGPERTGCGRRQALCARRPAPSLSAPVPGVSSGLSGRNQHTNNSQYFPNWGIRG